MMYHKPPRLLPFYVMFDILINFCCSNKKLHQLANLFYSFKDQIDIDSVHVMKYKYDIDFLHSGSDSWNDNFQHVLSFVHNFNDVHLSRKYNEIISRIGK